jgi:hypothetical protein
MKNYERHHEKNLWGFFYCFLGAGVASGNIIVMIIVPIDGIR